MYSESHGVLTKRTSCAIHVFPFWWPEIVSWFPFQIVLWTFCQYEVTVTQYIRLMIQAIQSSVCQASAPKMGSFRKMGSQKIEELCLSWWSWLLVVLIFSSSCSIDQKCHAGLQVENSKSVLRLYALNMPELIAGTDQISKKKPEHLTNKCFPLYDEEERMGQGYHKQACNACSSADLMKDRALVNQVSYGSWARPPLSNEFGISTRPSRKKLSWSTISLLQRDRCESDLRSTCLEPN